MFNNIMLGIFGFLAISFSLILLYAVIDPEPKQKQPNTTK